MSNLEHAIGNATAAAEARLQALDVYLVYRRAGGVSQHPQAKLYALVAQTLTTQQSNNGSSTLAALAQYLNLPDAARPAIVALQAILAGSRDFALADDPNLYFGDAVELRLLLAQLCPA
ncbi:MAG: hypothetical protein ACRERE_00105 [Candidatus Entotheonellia bacterium]